jgi:hypothetical protein
MPAKAGPIFVPISMPMPAIKAAVTPDRPLGIGRRLSGEAAAAAPRPEALAAVRAQLCLARRL